MKPPIGEQPEAIEAMRRSAQEATAGLPTTPAARQAEEQLLLARLAERLPADQFEDLSKILRDPETFGTPLGVPNDFEGTKLIYRLNALHDAARGDAQLDMMKAAALTHSAPLRIIALDRAELGRGALLARLIRTPGGENTLILAGGDVSPKAIALGLRTLELSRLEHGEIPQQTVTVNIRRGAPMSAVSSAKMGLAEAFVARLQGAGRTTHPGFGMGRAVNVTIDPVKGG